MHGGAEADDDLSLPKGKTQNALLHFMQMADP
jgi:hypothetical protein